MYLDILHLERNNSISPFSYLLFLKDILFGFLKFFVLIFFGFFE